MVYSLVITTSAKRDIQKLDSITQKRLKKKLEYFVAQNEPLQLAKPLTNHKDAQYRLRIGKYRILLDVAGSIITVLRVDKRSDIYRLFML